MSTAIRGNAEARAKWVSVALCLVALPCCTNDHTTASNVGTSSNTSGADGATQPDATDDGTLQSDGSHRQDGRVDASADSAIPICELSVEGAQYIAELSCNAPLTEPPESSAVYDSLAKQEGGIVASFKLCESNPMAWYPDDPVAPTRLLACGAACARAGRLFPSFVASVKPFAGCEDPDTRRMLCPLAEAYYQFISELSCVIPFEGPDESGMAYSAVELRGAQVVPDLNSCDSDPLAWYPNDPTAPTRLVACGEACLQSARLFPAFIAAAKPLLGCDSATTAL